MRLLVALILAAIVLPALPGAANPDSPCLQTASDPEGDTQVPAGIPGFDAKPADLLSVALAWRDEGVVVTVQLAGDPRVSGAGPMTYSYWVGFEDGGKSSSGNRPTWTFQGSTTYDVIETMYWEGPQSYPVTWNGTTFSFLLPWSSFTAQYGQPWPDIGSPRASSAGPSAGLNNPSQDWVQFDSGLVPLRPCPEPTPEATPAPAEPQPPGAPAPAPQGTGSANPSPAPAAGGPASAPAGSGAPAARAAPVREEARGTPLPAAVTALALLAALALAGRRHA